MLECHELKVNNDILQEKLQKTEAEDNKTINEKKRFSCSLCYEINGRNSNNGEETNGCKECTKKKVKEIGLLSEKKETLEHSNKMLKEKNYKLQDEVKP